MQTRCQYIHCTVVENTKGGLQLCEKKSLKPLSVPLLQRTEVVEHKNACAVVARRSGTKNSDSEGTAYGGRSRIEHFEISHRQKCRAQHMNSGEWYRVNKLLPSFARRGRPTRLILREKNGKVLHTAGKISRHFCILYGDYSRGDERAVCLWYQPTTDAQESI